MHERVTARLQELEREQRRLQVERSRVTCYALLIVLIGAIAGAFIPGPRDLQPSEGRSHAERNR